MELILACDRPTEMLALVTEYTDDILRQGEDVKQCLSSQHLAEELLDMEGKYGPPDGRMYLALVHGQPVGCVALTKNDEKYCEIKRLYVRPAYRSLGIGRALTEQVIRDAREIGYQYMRLDTFPFMDAAIRMYQRYGFQFIPRYNDNPAKTALFMQLSL